MAVVELTARWWIRRKGEYFVRRPHERTHLKLDRQAVPQLAPEARVEINAEGERGDPLPKDRTGLYRILVAGGSAAECGLLDQSAAWPAVLQDLLNSTPAALTGLGASRVHVGNIGRSMMPCDRVAAMLEHTLPRYEKLDLVILMVGASDVMEWLESGAPAAVDLASRVNVDEVFGEHPETRFGWAPRRSALARLARNGMRKWTGKIYHRSRAGRRLVEFRRRRQQAELIIDRIADPQALLARFELHFRRTVLIAQARGARVILARQPWLDRRLTPAEEQIMWNFCASPLRYEEVATAYYSHEAVRPVLSQMDALSAAVADQLGVAHVDLNEAVEHSIENFYDYHHFTEQGARRVAEALLPAVAGHISEATPKLPRRSMAAAAGD